MEKNLRTPPRKGRYMKTSVHFSKSYFGVDACVDVAATKSCCLTSGDYPTVHSGGVEGFCKRTYLLDIEVLE